MLQGRFFRRIVELKSRLDREPSLPFSDVLSCQRITALLKELKALYRDRLYPPWATLWIFLSQVLSSDHSCREALARWLAFRAARGLGPCSTDTGSYCQARKRLTELRLFVHSLAPVTYKQACPSLFPGWFAARVSLLPDHSRLWAANERGRSPTSSRNHRHGP